MIQIILENNTNEIKKEYNNFWNKTILYLLWSVYMNHIILRTKEKGEKSHFFQKNAKYPLPFPILT